MKLPQGYDNRPFGYVGDLYTASQMMAFRHEAIEETEIRLSAQNLSAGELAELVCLLRLDRE